MNRNTSDIFDSPLPHDTEAERALLGAIVLDPKIMPEVDARGIRTADFHDVAHQAAWGSMRTLLVNGRPIDPALLLPLLREMKGEHGTAAAAMIAELIRTQPTTENWPHYADRILEVAGRRRVRIAGENLLIASANGKAPAAAADDAIRMLSGVKAGTAGTGKVITYRRLTCQELDAAEFTTEYLIEWLLVAGQPCVIAGPKKACKTTILCALAIALTIGGKFLGMFNVTRCCRVLFMSGESGLATLQETLRRIAHANGHFLSDIGGLIISDQLPVLGQADYMAALRKMITDDEIEILILDPAYLCLSCDGNEGSLFAMGALLRGISELCQELGVTLVLCHHTKKGIADPFQPPELEGIAWSGFQEWARQWLLIGRRDKYEPGTGKHELWLSAGGSAGHSSLWALDINEGAFSGTTPRSWNVQIMRPEDARQQADNSQAERRANEVERRNAAQLEADRKKLVKVLVKCPAGETKSVLRDRSGVKSGRMDEAIASLLEDGTIVGCEIGRANGRQYDAFKINETKDSEA